MNALDYFKKYFTLACKIVFALSLTAVAIWSIVFYRGKQRINKETIAFGETITKNSVHKIDSILLNIRTAANTLADSLSHRKYTKAELEKALSDLGNSQAYILGVTAAYLPYEFSPDQKLYAPFYTRKEDKIIQTSDLYDYTDRTVWNYSAWVYNPIENNIFWAEPGFGPAAQSVVTEYGVPFYDPKDPKKKIGVVDITFSLHGFNKMLNTLKLGKTGYAILVSDKGHVLSHPREDYLLALKSMDVVAKETDDENYRAAVKKLLNKETGYVEYLNPLLNRKSIVFYQTIPTTQWSIAINIIKDEIEPDFDYTYKQEIILSLFILLAILSGSVVFFKLFQTDRLWVIAAEISFLFILEIGFIWHLHQQRPMFDYASDETVISDVNSINTFVNQSNGETETLHEEPPIYIPTGLFIRNIEFKDGRLIGLNGSLWQKLDTVLHKGIEPGVTFPDLSTDAEAYTMDVAYDRIEDGHRIIGWNFRLNILNKVDYKLYPFDRKDLKINLRHSTVGKNIFLIPDADAYESLIPSTNPGINKGIPIVGWDFLGSYFSYEYKSLNTNFGLQHFQRQRNIPELSFNVVLSRKIIGALIAHILPLFIIQLMLFGVIIIFSKTDTTISGYNTFGVINSCAAFFFVIVISHIDLRNTLEIEMVTYLEYLYFIVYIYVLMVTVNALFFSSTKDYLFVDYKNNYLPKVLFWPVFMFACIVVTIILFY
ncbi:PDC sensor domain-containing protein [Cytophaga aurantiaca]|uniref:PDC sensor domain-containing protein n=1 Tax=Cytophaga aurantiaca TaxID=29530 RepID=UPI0003745185|nr:cache domain-containing protein [Cytophaga aurantiaca]